MCLFSIKDLTVFRTGVGRESALRPSPTLNTCKLKSAEAINSQFGSLQHDLFGRRNVCDDFFLFRIFSFQYKVTFSRFVWFANV